MTDNPYARLGRERKAVAIEHALHTAGATTLDALRRLVLPDPHIRQIAEQAAADSLGHTWRKPASDCGPGQHTGDQCCTWRRVEALYEHTERTRNALEGQR